MIDVGDEIQERVRQLGEICQSRNWRVGFAESCTGGLLSSWVGSQPGVSAFFSGAVVSYAQAVKIQVLDVPKSLIAAHGEVSLPVVVAMAHGGVRALGCDWCVAISGIAGPSGGSPDKPVGTVCFAAVGPGFERVSQQVFPASGGRQDIQRQAALFAFDFLLNGMR